MKRLERLLTGLFEFLLIPHIGEDVAGDLIEKGEGRSSLIFTSLGGFFTFSMWGLAVFLPKPILEIFIEFWYSPLIFLFVATYFFLYGVSKLLIAPSKEDLDDDTSLFALFSACQRKFYRSQISAGVSVFVSIGYGLLVFMLMLEFYR